jgi:phenylacetate-coenzyme A ligase PaaK-like adenylate-forming protein
MIWDKTETISRNSMRELQRQRLVALTARVYENVPFYRASMDAAGVKPSHIHTLKDIAALPFTVKTDLRISIRSAYLPSNISRSSGYMPLPERRASRSWSDTPETTWRYGRNAVPDWPPVQG